MIKIYYDKRKYKNIDIKKEIDEFIININNKQLKLIEDNSYEIFKFCTTFFCKYCDNVTYIDEYCIEHYDKCNKNDIRAEYINKCYKEINNYSTNINKLFKKYHTSSIMYMNKIYKILNYYNKHIFKKFNVTPYYSDFNIKQNEYLDYNQISFKFDEIIHNNFIEYQRKYKINCEIKVNIIILLILLNKKIIRKLQITQNFIKKIKKNKNIPKYIASSNSIKLFYRIINSPIVNYIEYINTEYIIYIYDNQLKKIRESRVDIFIILNIDNTYHKLIIETDEKHHYMLNNIDTMTLDFYKDNYAIKSKTSILRIDIDDRIDEININFTLFLIHHLIKTKEPIYYFNDKYINFRNKIEKYNNIHKINQNMCIVPRILEKGTITIGKTIIGIYT